MTSNDALPGRLIAVEGIDGSGKSTQIDLLYKWLQQQGCRVAFTAWNSSTLVKPATKKGKRAHLLTPTTFSLIHATDFADRYERQILPMLRAGFIVLCDRYTFTAYARDRARGCDPGWLRTIYGFAVEPDLTFFHHVPVQTALDRIHSGRSEPNYFEAGMDMDIDVNLDQSFLTFQTRVTDQYLKLVEEYGLIRVDATRHIHELQEEIRARVADAIDLSAFADPNADDMSHPNTGLPVMPAMVAADSVPQRAPENNGGV